MDARLLDLLVCPVCKGALDVRKTQAELVCPACRLSFPIRDGLPVMIEQEARELTEAEARRG